MGTPAPADALANTSGCGDPVRVRLYSLVTPSPCALLSLVAGTFNRIQLIKGKNWTKDTCTHNLYTQWRNTRSNQLRNVSGPLRKNVTRTYIDIVTLMMHFVVVIVIHVPRVDLASSPGHSQLFNVARWKAGRPDLRSHVKCVIIHRKNWMWAAKTTNIEDRAKRLIFQQVIEKKGHSSTYFNRSLVKLWLFPSKRAFLCVRKR